MRTSTRDDVKQLAIAIESLAREVQSRIDSGSDVLPTANELIRNNLTLVFALGEVSAIEQVTGKVAKVGTAKAVTAKTVKAGTKHNYSNYYRVRDTSGRFVPKV